MYKNRNELYSLELEAYLEAKMGTPLYRKFRKKTDAISLFNGCTTGELERIYSKHIKRSKKLAEKLGLNDHFAWYTRPDKDVPCPLPDPEKPEIRAQLFAIANLRKAEFHVPALFCLAILFTIEFERKNDESN